jgi:undecaprenyl diphosphate synthase
MLIDGQPIPPHVAIIMDGNGRWAKDRGRPRPDGHREGMRAVIDTVKSAADIGVKALTLYAFSEQNWARPEDEVGGLMKLIVEYLIAEREMFVRDRVRLRAIGRTSRLPPIVRQTLTAVEQFTAPHERMTLSLCLSYGGREEIADGLQSLAARVARGELAPEQVDEARISEEIPSIQVGPVDLMIRTGGEQRTSNFLVWAGVHSELYFCPKLWPDFSRADLTEAIGAVQQRRLRRAAEAASAPTALAG